MSQLVTGEAVALDLRLAALPSRIVAGTLDAALQLLALGIVGGVATQVSLDLSSAAVGALTIVVIVLVLIVYPVAFETLLRGRTPGKAAMGLRAVRDDGGPIGFRQALVRGLVGGFVEGPVPLLFLPSVVTMLLNPQGKRLGDLMAGTVVLQERVSGRGGVVATMPPPLAGWAAGRDLTGLSDELALSVRQFVARSADLTPAAREDLGSRLVSAVVAAVGPPPPGTPGWAVLSAVLAERRRREYERLAGQGGGFGGPAVARPVASDGATAAAPVAQESPPVPGPGGFIAPS